MADTQNGGRKFDPWEGKRYGSDGLFGIRLLILGEAHYGRPEELVASNTIDVVRKLGQQKRFRFFTVAMSLVLGRRGPFSDAERAEFWERVAYCNFIQSFPGAGPRKGPTPDQWLAGREPLLFTLAELKPQLLLVLGKNLRNYLPELPEYVHPCYVGHPSGQGFRYDELWPKVREAVAAAGGRYPSAELENSAP